MKNILFIRTFQQIYKNMLYDIQKGRLPEPEAAVTYMKIPSPYIPVRVETNGLCHTVRVLDREYTFGADGLLTSVLSQGHELLAGPVRVVCREDGEDSVWDDNYPENEAESFIQHRSDAEAVICGAKQSDRFITEFCNTVDYDGNIEIDLKLMPRGKTVAQVFGTAAVKQYLFKLDRLWLEIPLRADAMSLFTMYPNSALSLEDGTVIPQTSMGMSGRLPEISAAMPFKALLWLGDDDRGFGWYAENERNWQPEDPNRSMELVRDGDALVLRIRLLDSHPASWTADPEQGSYAYTPVTFRFGFHATPVKTFPKQPYIHKALHLDCGIKVKGNYIDFLSAENRFDHLVEMGVDTLILHEKWNKCQNWFELSEFTEKQIKYIVDECHKRHIKVLTYFGYELSSMVPQWPELEEEVTLRNPNGTLNGGWWRVPFQRDYRVCYNSSYADLFVNGIAKIMDECHIDGIYLDGTAQPVLCANTKHGCGWTDHAGNLRGTYQIHAIRRMFKKLREAVVSRGGVINVHFFGCVNFTALPYIDQTWYGENLQFALMKGSTEDMALDYFRAEYTGRNMGVPVEFIAYENRPLWTFENAVSCSILHGILPRPNDIGHPLTLMSGIWKIMDGFPVAQSQWLPYWKNGAQADHDKVKISYYKYTTLTGKTQLLAFAVNISASPVDAVTVQLREKVTKVTDMEENAELGFTFPMAPYAYRILYIE